MIRKCLVAAVCGAILCLPFTAAQARGISGVSGASVDKGSFEVEGRIGWQADDDNPSADDRIRSRINAEYGVTEVWSTEILVFWDKREGDNWQYDAMAFENRFQILDESDYGFDAAIDIEYAINESGADEVEIGFRQELPLSDKWELRLNQNFSHEVGSQSESGLNAGLRGRTTYAAFEDHDIGFESFHEFGNLRQQSGYSAQEHTLGLLAKGDLGINEVEYFASPYVGLSNGAADYGFKLFLGREF